MFPFCLPLLFNAKVLAKDIFFLLLYFSILFCTVGQLPAPALATVPWLGLSWLVASGGSRNAGLLDLFIGLANGK